MNEKVFVYGTLRKNLSWHHLLENSEFIGNAITEEKYSMYADSIPYVIESEKISNIVGEVYLVDEKTFKKLDQLEGHPNWYQRKKIAVVLKDEKIECWIYFYPNSTGQKILSGDYLNFLSIV